jgi:hypothetical protein
MMSHFRRQLPEVHETFERSESRGKSIPTSLGSLSVRTRQALSHILFFAHSTERRKAGKRGWPRRP